MANAVTTIGSQVTNASIVRIMHAACGAPTIPTSRKCVDSSDCEVFAETDATDAGWHHVLLRMINCLKCGLSKNFPHCIGPQESLLLL